MKPMPPDLDEAIAAVREYQAFRAQTLTRAEKEALFEISRRLQRMNKQAKDLISINNKIIDRNEFSIRLDERGIVFRNEDGTETIKSFADLGIPVKGQPKLVQSAIASTYHAGDDSPIDEEDLLLRVDMEDKLEMYYYNAHRVITLKKRTKSFPTVSCLPMTIVRNHLVEHPDRHESSYTFGVSTQGPQVKPVKRSGTEEPRDLGLVPNTREFVKSIADKLRSSIN